MSLMKNAEGIVNILIVSLIVNQTGCSKNEDGRKYDINMDIEPEIPETTGDNQSAICRLDFDCSNGIFCDGVEKCVNGVCQQGDPIVCDDHINCTKDECNEELNTCVYLPDDSLCNDGNICNGEERCAPNSPFADRVTGCVSGTPIYCDDGNECSEDYCDETTGMCKARLKDADKDGYGDKQCSLVDESGNRISGNDCNDTDPGIHPGAEEVCNDGIDNNCDRMIDLYDSRCIPENDTCSNPVELPPGETIVGSTRTTRDDYTTGCGGTGKMDVVFTLILSEDHDVGINVFGDFTPVIISVQSICGNSSSEIYCGENSLWARGLEAGTYYIIVEGSTQGNFEISTELAPYTNVYNVPPTNDNCSSPFIIPPEGGLFLGATTGMTNDFTASCGANSNSPDVVFELTLSERKTVTASTTTNYDGTIYMRESPCSSGREIVCNDDYPDTRHSRISTVVNPGTYYIFVDGYSSSNSGNYEMNVVITAAP